MSTASKLIIMNLSLIVLFIVLRWSILSVQLTRAREDIEIKVLNNASSESCQESRFTLDDNYRRPRGGHVLDCFGIGMRFAGLLDWFLRRQTTYPLKVKFHLVTRKQPRRVTLTYGDAFTSDDVDFDIKRRTMFIVHGFLCDGEAKWIKDMTQALLEWVCSVTTMLEFWTIRIKCDAIFY